MQENTQEAHPTPGGYNRVDPDDGMIVWTECECGWKTRKHKAGRRHRIIATQPFFCPKCGTELSSTSVYGRK